MIAILQIIDQLEALLENSKRVPMSTLRMIDYAQFQQAIERLRISVPSSIMEGERTLLERDRILEAGEAEAARMVEQARRRVNEILSNDALVAAARQEGERLLINAEEVAQQRRDEADRYAARVLEDLAEKLRIVTKQVDNGLELLRQNMELEQRAHAQGAEQAAQQAQPPAKTKPAPKAQQAAQEQQK